jgi:uncharacterized membrane protein (UPF0127 family)
MASFLSAAAKAAPGTGFELVLESSGRVVVPDLEVAIESATRKKGLLGRDGLADGSGLVIAPTNAVHTFFMRFPIDILFVTKGGEIVKVRSAVPPWRMAAALRGYAVIELAAGGATRAGLEVGDRVAVRRRESQGARSFV